MRRRWRERIRHENKCTSILNNYSQKFMLEVWRCDIKSLCPLFYENPLYNNCKGKIFTLLTSILSSLCTDSCRGRLVFQSVTPKDWGASHEKCCSSFLKSLFIKKFFRSPYDLMNVTGVAGQDPKFIKPISGKPAR